MRLTSLTVVVVAIVAIMATVLPASAVDAHDNGALNGRVFLDANSNGTQDVGEPGIANLIVYARSGGVVAASTTSGTDGSYEFNDLPAASYQVQFAGLLGREFTVQDQGVSDLIDSDVDPTTGLTSVFALAAGETIGSIDAGVLPPEPPAGAISGVVFTDENEDGVRQPDERLEPYQQVWLRDGEGALIETNESTDESGRYEFSGLAAGLYSIELPTDFVGIDVILGFAPKDAGGDDSIDSDVDPATGASDQYVVDGDVVTNVDAGILAARSIQGTVFFDANGDGIQDPGEGWFPDLIDAFATVRDDAGNIIDTVRFEDTFYFLTVPTGDYRVEFDLIAPGTEITVPNAGDDDAVDSDVDPATGVSDVVSVGPDQRFATVDVGMRTNLINGVIYGRVWLDANKNGLQDSGERALAGATVTVYDIDGELIDEVVTDGGSYQFRNLASGQYRVEYELPPGFAFSAANVGANDAIDSDPIDGVIEAVQVVSGSPGSAVDAGATRDGPLLTVGDFLFLDANENGLQDAGEVGEEGISVELVAPGSRLALGSDVTDASGRYEIAAPNVGEYQLIFRLVGSDLVATEQGVGADDAIDSDIDATGRTTSFTITDQDPVLMTIDAGVIRPSASIGGRVFFDENENGLQDAGEEGIDGNVRVRDATGAAVGGTRTSENGAWKVDNLRSGEYRVQFIVDRSLQFTQQDQGDDDSIDSDADPQTGRTSAYTLIPGQTIEGVDAGVVPLSELGSMGGLVFFDDDNDGIRGPDDFGARGVASVAVFDADREWVDWAEINSDGAWVVSDLAPGDYYASFGLAPGLVFAPRDQGADDSIDSDAEALIGDTALYAIGPGENLVGVDAGIRVDASMTAAVGDFVFEDLDADGWQDSIEPGFPGVTIEVVHISGRVVAVTASDTNGAYLVSDLLPGEYSIRVALPDGRTFTTNDRTGPLNSDIDPTTGSSPVFLLEPGEVVGGIDVGVLTIDDDVLGDVNCDGDSNIVDALFIVYFDSATRTGVESCIDFYSGTDVIALQNGDVNADGDVNIIDALLIAQCDAAVNNVFCPAPE